MLDTPISTALLYVFRIAGLGLAVLIFVLPEFEIWSQGSGSGNWISALLKLFVYACGALVLISSWNFWISDRKPSLTLVTFLLSAFAVAASVAYQRFYYLEELETVQAQHYLSVLESLPDVTTDFDQANPNLRKVLKVYFGAEILNNDNCQTVVTFAESRKQAVRIQGLENYESQFFIVLPYLQDRFDSGKRVWKPVEAFDVSEFWRLQNVKMISTALRQTLDEVEKSRSAKP